MSKIIKFGSVLSCAALSSLSVVAADSSKPNILLIVADDLGYSDCSFNPFHSEDVNTPNIDKLAAASVVCTDGYVTAHISSASRTGLLTGQYQQRWGIYTAPEGGNGVSMDATIFPTYLKSAGYVSGQFGKWHLGHQFELNPRRRGFDFQYGFLGRGGHDYYKLNDPKDPIYRNEEVIEEKEGAYFTDRIAEEAIGFITENRDKPFFAYLAFNAVHTPLQAPEEVIAKFNTGDKNRDTILAMGQKLDDAIGDILNTIEEFGLRENTIVYFISDNGGALKQTSENKPLRGGKHNHYEGGIRVPFLVSWPKELKPSTISTPVIALDILPTTLAAVGIEAPKGVEFDGVNILPMLKGKQKQTKERPLFWSGSSNDPWWAIRVGDWKVVGVKGETTLYNLKDDIGESVDLSTKHPEKFEELCSLHNNWLDQMVDPTTKGGAKRWTPEIAAAAAAAAKQKRDRANK